MRCGIDKIDIIKKFEKEGGRTENKEVEVKRFGEREFIVKNEKGAVQSGPTEVYVDLQKCRSILRYIKFSNL